MMYTIPFHGILMIFLTPLLIVAQPVELPAEPPPPAVMLPAEVNAAPGRIVQLKAETTGRSVRWALASDDADLIPFPGGKVALFSAAKPGRYLVFAWTAAGDEPSEAARCVVVVGSPPGPGPPTDPFAAELQRLFASDPTPDKAAHRAQLAALYREAVAFAKRPDVRTAGELAARIRSAAAALLPADALTNIRKRIAEEIAKTLPVDGDRPLDPATRSAAGHLFDRIATALESIP